MLRVKKIKGVTADQKKDYIFCKALSMAVGSAVDQFEYNISCRGIYFPEIKFCDLIVRLDSRTNTLHIHHWFNPFIRMKEKDFNGWVELIKEEDELFG